jgi:hypothetical protein
MGKVNTSENRREFVKRAAYIAPVILTLAAAPAYAKSGSDKKPKLPKGNDDQQGQDDR